MARFAEAVERGQIDIVPKVMVGGSDGRDGTPGGNTMGGNMLGALMAMMLAAQAGVGPIVAGNGKEKQQPA